MVVDRVLGAGGWRVGGGIETVRSRTLLTLRAWRRRAGLAIMLRHRVSFFQERHSLVSPRHTLRRRPSAANLALVKISVLQHRRTAYLQLLSARQTLEYVWFWPRWSSRTVSTAVPMLPRYIFCCRKQQRSNKFRGKRQKYVSYFMSPKNEVPLLSLQSYYLHPLLTRSPNGEYHILFSSN